MSRSILALAALAAAMGPAFAHPPTANDKPMHPMAARMAVPSRADHELIESAMRAARATMTAAEVLGSYDAARAYMHTKNFALGGATPTELVKTSDGERIVLNELQAQDEGGPL